MSGLILTILLFFSTASHLSEQIEENIDTSIDHPDIDHPDIDHPDIDHPDIDHPDIDHPDIDHPDIDHPDIDHPDIDHPDIEFNIGSGHLDDFVHSKTHTPLSLLFSLYLLWFGAIGLIGYDIFNQKIIWLAIILVLPIGFVKVVDLVWCRIATNTQYRIRKGNELLGSAATVKIAVSTEGGLVSLNHVTEIGVQTIAAKSLFPLSYFYTGDKVWICKYSKGTYFVDSNPASIIFPGKRIP
ncbi:MAG: hypothetical protein ACTSWW_05490 [Promethearchaeota archaeon]